MNVGPEFRTLARADGRATMAKPRASGASAQSISAQFKAMLLVRSPSLCKAAPASWASRGGDRLES
jgi:hypothetical protein